MKNSFISILCCLALLSAVVFGFSGQKDVSAQTSGSVTVQVLDAVGGTTDPAPGTYTYTSPNQAILTAIPDAGWTLNYWVFSGPFVTSHFNPLGMEDPSLIYGNPIDATHGWNTLGYTYSYQPVFVPAGTTVSTPTTTATPSSTATPAPTPSSPFLTIEVLSSLGGTTNPAPGIYSYSSPDQAILTATAYPGWQFEQWTFSGPYTSGHVSIPSGNVEPNVILNNPADVTHNWDTAGYTYSYQAVFVPIAAASANKGVPISYVAILVVALAVIAVVAAAAVYRAGKRKA
jgi:hypothetical protein